MLLKDILAHKSGPAEAGQVWGIAPDQTLAEAVAAMVEHRVGALLVRDNDGIKGIISERDILRTCNDRAKQIGSILVRDVMTADLVIGRTGDTVEYAAGVMTERRIRHLPVFEDSMLAGIVSIGDLVKAQLKKADVEIRMLQHYIEGGYPG